jgi:hypothetical protein
MSSWMTRGFGGLLMGNLFAFRATDPKAMVAASDPVGPDADVWLTTMAVRSGLTVAAWGAHRFAKHRAPDVVSLLGEVHALGTTRDGAPRHPLYLRADAKPRPWSAE